MMRIPTELVIKYDNCDRLEKDYIMDDGIKIILKEGERMEKRVAKDGMEKLFAEVNELIANLDADRDEAIRVAVEEVNAKFAKRTEDLNNALIATSDVIIVDDPVVEETEEVPAEEIVE